MYDEQIKLKSDTPNLDRSDVYNRTDWLGVKHQFTYLLTPNLDLLKSP